MTLVVYIHASRKRAGACWLASLRVGVMQKYTSLGRFNEAGASTRARRQDIEAGHAAAVIENAGAGSGNYLRISMAALASNRFFGASDSIGAFSLYHWRKACGRLMNKAKTCPS